MKQALVCLLAFALVVAVSGCSKLQEDPNLAANEPLPSIANAVYAQPQKAYPHPTLWKKGHIEYMGKLRGSKKPQAEALLRKCDACHKGDTQLSGHPMPSISCAGSCHKAGPTIAPAALKKTSMTAPVASLFPGAINCLDCHDNHATDKFSHYPVAENLCFLCHQAQPDHPEVAMDSDAKDKHVTIGGPETCFQCHDNPMNQPVVHGAIDDQASDTKTGQCANCHNPHGSKKEGGYYELPAFLRVKKLLPTDGDAPTSANAVQLLCKSCHGDPTGGGTKSHPTMKPADDCTRCHLPHSGSFAVLMKQKKDGNPNCRDCHGDMN